jgi:hypothetical protein
MYQPPQPPFVSYPPPEKKSYTGWWIALGIGVGIMLCACSTAFLVLMTNHSSSTTTTSSRLYSWDIEATETAQAGSETHTFVLTSTPGDDVPANPWGYNFEPEVGHYIYNEPATFCRYFKCATPFGTANDGFIVECNDGRYVHNGGGNDACYGHDGVKHALYWH